MSNVVLKNVPSLTLEAVIKRRKTTLKKFVNDAGVQTYSGLKTLCDRMGVKVPLEVDYVKEVNPPIVTSQQDGIVVIEPQSNTEKLSPADELVRESERLGLYDEHFSKKSRKNRKKNQPSPVLPSRSLFKKEIVDEDQSVVDSSEVNDK